MTLTPLPGDKANDKVLEEAQAAPKKARTSKYGQPLNELLAKAGISPSTFYRRLRQGMTPEEALAAPKTVKKGKYGKPLAALISEAGISAPTFYRRQKVNGYSPEEALTRWPSHAKTRFDKPMAYYAGKIGVSVNTLYRRLKKMSLEEAVAMGNSERAFRAKKAREISSRMGLTVETVRRKLQAGVKPEEITDTRRFPKGARKKRAKGAPNGLTEQAIRFRMRKRGLTLRQARTLPRGANLGTARKYGKMTVAEMAGKLGMTVAAVWRRLNKGMAYKDILKERKREQKEKR